MKPYAYESGGIESETIGRCQREVNCGYHLKPKDYFSSIGDMVNNQVTFTPLISRHMYVLPKKMAEKCLSNTEKSTLLIFLNKTGIDFSDIFKKYHVGSTISGQTVFLQFDGAVYRTGKIIKYLENGRRDKSVGLPAFWLHKKDPDYNDETQELRQCLFGRHLLDKAELICIVESEKTALICSGVFNQKNVEWMATGGRTQLSGIALSEMAKKKVLLFPDDDSILYWSDRVRAFPNCEVVDTSIFNSQRIKGADLADYILSTDDSLRNRLFSFVKNKIKSTISLF